MDNLLRDPVLTRTSNFTVDTRVPFYFIDASAGDITIMLMAPTTMVSASGKQARTQFKRIDTSSNVVTIKTPSGGIENNGDTYTLYPLQSVTMFSNRENYFVQRGRDVSFNDLRDKPELLQGEKGERGEQGEVGSVGPTGSQGPQGIAGPTGPKGDTGNTGATGPQGLQGIQGLKGDIGSQGIKGDTGLTGAQGIQGIKGDTGTQGSQGLQGPQGIKGDTGLTGPKGDTGNQGIQGPSGVTNVTGLIVAGSNVTITGAGTSASPYSIASSQMSAASSGNNGYMSAADKSKLDSLPNSVAQLLGTVTVTETAVIALSAGVRKVTVTAPGTVVGGNYLLFPIAVTPANYALADVVCVVNGQLQVSVTAPILALGATYSFTCRLVKIL